MINIWANICESNQVNISLESYDETEEPHR